jgi:hypothetical protein
MSRDWPTVNFPTDRAISISPRRAAERLSLPANPSRSAAPPSFFRGDAEPPRQEDGKSKANTRTYGLIRSSYPVEQLLGACFQIEPTVLMGCAAGTFRDAIRNRTFLCELCLDTFAYYPTNTLPAQVGPVQRWVTYLPTRDCDCGLA